MPSSFLPAAGLLAQLDLLHIEHSAAVSHLRLMRPAKRNAINDALVGQLHTAFVNLPEATQCVVLSGEGDHFCAGLDLSELGERSVARRKRSRPGANLLLDTRYPSIGIFERSSCRARPAAARQ